MTRENSRNHDRPAAGRPTPDPAWRLLGHVFTGYDWHGGYHAAVPVARPGPFARFLRGRRQARQAERELAALNARDRIDAGLAPASPPDPGRRWDHLWQRGGAGAVPRADGCCQAR